MEAKKNPDKDLNRKSFEFFCIGLIISLTLLITAFEWRTKKSMKPPRDEAAFEPNTVWELKPAVIEIPDKPKTISTPPVRKSSVILETTETTESKTAEVFEPLPEMELHEPFAFSLPLEKESTDSIMTFPEQFPEPINGMNGFYKLLSDNMKYPRAAIRQGVEGKVFVEFVIDKKGQPAQMKVTKGIGAGCDEEAIRVIGLSRWRPGKQRGVPVLVRMTIPVTFKLTH